MWDYFKNVSDFESIFLWIALASTFLFIVQSVFSFLDIGDNFDFGNNADFDIAEGLGMPFHLFTVRGVIGFLMLFGWSGFIFANSGMDYLPTILLALICGFIMMFLIALIYYFVNRLGESGNVDIKTSIGKECEVYIPIPGEKSGIGKVSILLNNSLKEMEAVTFHETLPSGEIVHVVDIINDKLVVEKKFK